MLGLRDLAALYAAHGDLLDAPIAQIRLGGRNVDVEASPLLMGVLNLSRDSTYRDSVAVSAESAIRRGRVLAAQGALLIDLGAESTNATASRVSDREQIAALVPVVAALAGEGIHVSIEAYSRELVRECLDAGAAALNLTGRADAEAIYALAAERDVPVILCALPGETARSLGGAALGADPLAAIVDELRVRVTQAAELGVTNLIVDPGLGFFYSNLTDPAQRTAHQSNLLLQSFRMRELGHPICQSLPHAFDYFEDEFRSAESFFAVLALVGGAQILRTHEVSRVTALLRAWQGIQKG